MRAIPATGARRLTGLDALVGLALVTLTGAIYAASPNHVLGDSHYTLLVSTSLLEDRTFALDRFLRRPLDPAQYPNLGPHGVPSGFTSARGRVYHGYPPGTPILTLPFVAMFRAAGIRPASTNDVYDQRAEAFMQAVVSGLLMAVLSAVAYAGARAFLPVGASAALTLAATLGSPIWSTASRALGSQTWQVLLVTTVTTLLLWEERDGRRFPAWWMGTLLAWAFWVRPSAAPMIVGVAAFLALRDGPRRVLSFAAGGAPWAALFLWYSLHNLGTLVPDYYRGSYIRLRALGPGLAGTLVSPSRGLLVFCPVVAALVFLCFRHRRRLPSPRLAWLASSVIAAHVLIAGANVAWWGGHSYGPRLHTDLVPWFVVLATLTLAAVRAAPEPPAAKAWRAAVLGALAAWGIVLHGWGAVEAATVRWNYLPASVDERPQALWSWRDAQFLAGLPGAARRRRLAPVSPGARIAVGASPQGDPYVVDGWWASSEGTRWSCTRRAIIAVPGCRPPCRSLVLRLTAFAPPGKARQPVEARIDGAHALAFSVPADAWEEVVVPLPAELRAGDVRELSLSVPEAVAVGDQLLAIRVEWMELR